MYDILLYLIIISFLPDHYPCVADWWNFRDKCFWVSDVEDKYDYDGCSHKCTEMGAMMASVRTSLESKFLSAL